MENFFFSDAELVQRFFWLSTDMICVVDMEGRFLKISDSWSANLGFEHDEIIGQKFLNFIHPDDIARTMAEFEQVIKGKRVLHFVNRYRHKQGHYITLEWTAAPDLEKGLSYSIARNITESHKIQSNLKALKNAIDTSFLRVEFDRGGIILAANENYLHKLGYEHPEEVVGQHHKKFVDPDQQKSQEYQQFWENLKSGLPQQGEFKRITKQGDILWLQATYTPTLDARGEVAKIIKIATDFPMLKKMNDKLQEQAEELERTNHSLGLVNRELESFAYSVSHDLKTPLRGICGWSSVLQEDYSHLLDETALEYLDFLQKEAQRMGDLIETLLQLSRISRSPLSPKKVNISRIAEEEAERFRIQEQGRILDFKITPNLSAKGDEGMLRVVLLNLLENAVKFSAQKPIAVIEFGQVNIDGNKTYFVRDNGAGFDVKFSKKMFEAFQRLHKQSEFPGTGVGLATVQRVIHRHWGNIWAESELGKGATFYFTLNLNKNESNIQSDTTR